MTTQIQSFYANSTILITGATGLLGNYLIEKLLRSCPDIKRIYLLIRNKRTKNSKDRLVDLLRNPVYNGLRKSDPQLLLKLEVLTGDLQLERLGLDDDDLGKVVSEVNCVFHVGATVKFMEKLRKAVLVNVKGVDSLIGICRLMQNLKSVVYVSTAFSQVANMNETFSPSFLDCDQLIEMTKELDKAESQILRYWPNTYIFTKYVAENLLQSKGKNLPIAIIRPSLVLPPYLKPYGDWSNSTDWFFTYCVSVSLGLWHTTKCNPNDVVDLIPVDFVVNHILATGWMIGTTWKVENPEVHIFNCVSSNQNPITWGRHRQLLQKYDAIIPASERFFSRFLVFSKSDILLNLIRVFFLPVVVLLNRNYSLFEKPFTSVRLYN